MKKKILSVSEHDLDSKGGIQHVMESIGLRLSDEFDIDAISFKEMTNNEKSIFSYYKNIYCINCDSNNRIKRIIENIFRPFKLYFSAKRIIQKGKYTAVHVHDTLKGAWFLRAAAKCNVPVRIMHCHNPEVKDPVNFLKRRYSQKMRDWIIKYSNVKIGCSQDACKSIFGEHSFNAFVVNNETDMSIFDLNKYPKMQNDGIIRFIHVGRFTYQKNHEFLIDTFSAIHDKLPNTQLTLVGWGQLEKNIREKIQNLLLTNFVYFKPANSNIAEEMSQADYMIFPSRYEGLGRVLIEAQIMNVMCFASDCVPQETNLGLCDYLPLNKGTAFWAQYIIEFIFNQNKSSKILNNEKVALFDINNIMKIYSDIYNGKY